MSTEVEHDEPQGSFFPSVERMDQLSDELKGKTATREDLRRVRRLGERGRPPGSTNKRQEKVAQWFLHQYGNPLSVFGEIMNMPDDVIMMHLEALQGRDAKHKPLRAIDIFKLKMEAAEKAAPYVLSKQPVELQVSDARDFILNIPGLSLGAEGGGGVSASGPIDLIDALSAGAIDLAPISREIVDVESGE